MWTYDGILIEKKEEKYKVFSDNEKTFDIFTSECGELDNFFKEQIKNDIKEDGLYQAEVGYGPIGSMQDPSIYWTKKIGDVLDWEFPKEKKD